jgi:hypothetical protein
MLKFRRQILKFIFKRGYNKMKENKLNAVHDKDLKDFLKSIDELEKVKSGNAKCYFCNKTITFDNILSIFAHDKKVEFCCKTEDCYNKLMDLKDEKGND